MEQKKTGEFIQAMRKEKGLTQAELAEKLSVSDRAVSKWERGKCFPDASILESLCKELDITADELFSGEKNTGDGVKKEDDAIEHEAERKKNKTIFILSTVAVFAFLVPFFGAIFFASFAKIPDWERIVIIAAAFVWFLIVIFIVCYVDCKSGYYECNDCGERFQPTLKDYLSIKSAHTPTKRLLKCPRCGNRTWCKKRFTKK